MNMVTFAIDPRKTAVLIVDLQNGFIENSPITIPSGRNVIAKLNTLAARYRAAGSAIIWIRHVVRADHSDAGILAQTIPPVAGGLIDEGTRSAALHSSVAVEAGDIILAKPHFGAFQATELETILRVRAIDTVVIGGIATNFCCETTAREAHSREFKVLFLVDGTGTFDLPDITGGVIPVEQVQRAALATLAFGFAEVLSVADACRKLPAEGAAPNSRKYARGRTKTSVSLDETFVG
jgi:ureidoacrylate peracid hydrolase